MIWLLQYFIAVGRNQYFQHGSKNNFHFMGLDLVLGEMTQIFIKR